jgi:hypothetical protein
MHRPVSLHPLAALAHRVVVAGQRGGSGVQAGNHQPGAEVGGTADLLVFTAL